MSYGALPKVIGSQIALECPEMLFYQYMPIKMAGGISLKAEPRLDCFKRIIAAACCDFVGFRGLDAFVESYVYVTARCLYQRPGCEFNRPGWHADGFGTDDINYIWYDSCPTVFNSTQFLLSDDDEASMRQMEWQADEQLSVCYPVNTLLRLDQFCIHKVSPALPGVRTFLKVSISRDRYDLKGNSHNHLFDYDWPTRPRSLNRNVPQQLKGDAA